jgi:hypothetical protein
MAKKVIATLKKGESRTVTYCIKMVKSSKTGAYSFKEEMIPIDTEKDFFAKK